MNELSIYTDAGFKDDLSTHHWRVFDANGHRIKRLTFKATEENNNKAELQTINSVIQWLYKKNKGNATIYTDSMYCVKLLNSNTQDIELDGIDSSVKSDIDFLKFQMKGFNIKVEWVSRYTKQIKLADYYCSELMDTVLKRKEYTNKLTD